PHHPPARGALRRPMRPWPRPSLSSTLQAVTRTDPGGALSAPEHRSHSAPSATHGDMSDFTRILGQSHASRAMCAFGQRAAAVDAPVLLHGESGTGKGLLARAIHIASARARGPFIAVNCAGVPESLFESEFFGHNRGAFTGAHEARRGLFEQAHGGTLFLDEIGDLPLPL